MDEKRETRRWTLEDKAEITGRFFEYQAQFAKPRRLSGDFYREASEAMGRSVQSIQQAVTGMGLGYTTFLLHWENRQRELIRDARQLKRLAKRATYALGTNLDAHTRSEFVQSVKAAVALIEQAYPVDE